MFIQRRKKSKGIEWVYAPQHCINYYRERERDCPSIGCYSTMTKVKLRGQLCAFLRVSQDRLTYNHISDGGEESGQTQVQDQSLYKELVLLEEPDESYHKDTAFVTNRSRK